MKKYVIFFIILSLSVLLQAQPNPAFMLDSSFGTNGVSESKQFNTGIYQVANMSGMYLQKDGKIVAGGTIGDNYNGYYNDGIIARYLPDGNVDTTFGNKGVVFADYNHQQNGISAIQKQSTGKIITLGGATPDSGFGGTYYLTRYNNNGAIDSSFARYGWLILPNPNSALVVQPDDKIIVCGDYSNFRQGSYVIKVRRYSKNGRPDSSFGINGLATITLGTKQTMGDFVSVALDNKQRIVIACYCAFETIKSDGITVVRLTSQGFADSSFNGTGITVGTSAPYASYTHAVCVQKDNKIVVGSTVSYTNDFEVSRFNEDGTEDKTFGNKGSVTTDFTVPGRHSSYDDLSAVAVQGDGKIVAVGSGVTIFTANYRFAVARYLPDGTPDSSFGFGNGKTITKIEAYDTHASTVVIQPDGKIIAGGYSSDDPYKVGYGGYLSLVKYLQKKKTTITAANKISVVKTNAVQSTIDIYPNPAKHVLFIKGLSAMPATYSIADAGGHTMQPLAVSNSEIGVTDLPAGIYYLQILQDRKLTTLKFIKE